MLPAVVSIYSKTQWELVKCSEPTLPTNIQAGRCGPATPTGSIPEAEWRRTAYLVELLPADGAVLLLAQHPHFGGAAVTHRVIAFSEGEYIDFLAAQNTLLLWFLSGCWVHGGDWKRHKRTLLLFARAQCRWSAYVIVKVWATDASHNCCIFDLYSLWIELSPAITMVLIPITCVSICEADHHCSTCVPWTELVNHSANVLWKICFFQS